MVNYLKNEKRREFLANFTKIGALGFISVASLANVFGVNLANTASKSAVKEGKMQYITLNNGIKMPILGLGTYGLQGKSGQEAIIKAIKTGYRLIDTAQMYANESEVGDAVAESIENFGIKRSEFFITTKLSSNMSYDETFRRFDESMKKLRLEYLDLLLIHDTYENARQMYKAMEKLYKDGKIKALGISNFNANEFSEFIKSAEIAPAINQCQTHIFHQQKHLRNVMSATNTRLQSWSPFVAGRKDFFNNKTLLEIAQKHDKSVAQVALRFLVQQDIIAIPKSSNAKRLRENFSIFDFMLDSGDMAKISALDTAKSQFIWDS